MTQLIATLILIAQTLGTAISDKTVPRFPSDAAVWKVDYAVADKDAVKVEAALSVLKADKQVKDQTYPVYMISWEGIDEKGGAIENDSGGFATKDDAMAWLKKLQESAKETPTILPKECKFYLTRVGHAPDPKQNQPCVKEIIKP